MLTIFEFKQQHIGFQKIPDTFLAAAALRFVTSTNLAICTERLLFLGVQALEFIYTIGATDKFRIYINDLRN